MNTQPERRDDPAPLGSPYGPFPHGVDESAGGADSSPLENDSTDERAADAGDPSGGKETAEQVRPDNQGHR